MKHSFLFTLALLISVFTKAQSQVDSPLPVFSAIIVSDIEKSTKWYTEVLAFTKYSDFRSEERGIKQVNLKSPVAKLELIELESSLDPKQSLNDYTENTRLQGFFKIGYQVSDFDTWLSRFRALNVNFHGNVVHDDKGKRMIILLDPDQNRIQIFEK